MPLHIFHIYIPMIKLVIVENRTHIVTTAKVYVRATVMQAEFTKTKNFKQGVWGGVPAQDPPLCCKKILGV